jgi:hypothetical protein
MVAFSICKLKFIIFENEIIIILLFLFLISVLVEFLYGIAVPRMRTLATKKKN